MGAYSAVRQGQQNRRGRGRNRKSQNPLSRSFESNGPEMKIRGTPAHIAEKYLALARDAQSSGDPVLAENYLQHAEHYIRIIMAYREQFNQPGEGMNGSGQRMRPEGAEGGEEFGDDDGDDPLDEVLQQPQPQFQPHQPMHQHGGRQGGQHEGNRHEGYRNDRPFRRDNRGYRDRDRDRQHGDRDRQGGEGRPQTMERPQEQAAEGGEGRRPQRFQQNEQPDFLRRPVRRARSESDEAAPPSKDEPSRD
jgi:hypothetical protein